MLHKVLEEEKFFLSNRNEDLQGKTSEALPVGIHTRYECQDNTIEWIGPNGAIQYVVNHQRLEKQYKLIDPRRAHV